MENNERIVITRLGESFRDCTRIETDTPGSPGEGQLRVRNRYAGVNGVFDQMMCLDRVEHHSVRPPTGAGVEAVGHVDAVGKGVVGFREGDAVAVVQVGGAYRNLQICDAAKATLVPEASPGVLAIVPSAVSALVALEQVGRMHDNEVVCISAAAGGLGSAMTQLAINAGNRVIAICGSDEKAMWLESKGVERVIQYRRESTAAVLASEYKDGLNLAMDSVGGETFDAMLAQLAPHGRLVVCGYTSDRIPTKPVTQERIYTQLYWKAASVRGFMNYRFAEYASEARERLLTLWAQGHWAPLIDKRPFKGLPAAADAVEWLLAGNNLGKVIIEL